MGVQLFSFVFLLAFQSTFCQRAEPYVALQRSSFKTRTIAVTVTEAGQALRIASYILNSRECRDSLQVLTFTSKNFCDKNERSVQRISGRAVLDRLIRDKEAHLNLFLKRVGKPPLWNKCFGLGKTNPDSGYITDRFNS